MASYGSASSRYCSKFNANEDDDDEDEDSLAQVQNNKNTISSSNSHNTDKNEVGNDEDEDDEDKTDKIRRHVVRSLDDQSATQQHPQTIRVKLDESSFLGAQRERLVNVASNCRQTIASLRLLAPTQDKKTIRKLNEWTDKEKFTLHSLAAPRAVNGVSYGFGGDDTNLNWTKNSPIGGRQVWESKLQYFLAITSYSIGLGNVIRFPILVQRNGGLAFIVQFLVMLVIEGIPLFYLELAVGQRMRKAAISAWNCVSPTAAGIGLAATCVSFVVGLNYNAMVAWTLFYLWTTASAAVFPTLAHSSQIAMPISSVDKTFSTSSLLPFAQCSPLKIVSNQQASDNSSSFECQTAGPYQYFWYRQTLDATSQVNDWSNFNTSSFTCLAVAWLISFWCIAWGLSTSKRVVYVTSTFPYVILLVFLLKICTLDGVSEGVLYLLAPDWSKLAQPFIWLQAAAQVFFSLGLGFGGLIALSSYNPINNNCYKDAIKVSLVNFVTSMLAAIVVFGVLGFKSKIDTDKCLVERDQRIEFYLSDYYLKVIDYGFNESKKFIDEDDRPIYKLARLQQEEAKDIKQLSLSSRELGNILKKYIEDMNEHRDKGEKINKVPTKQDDYYNFNDVLASIKSLNKQLDGSSESTSPRRVWKARTTFGRGKIKINQEEEDNNNKNNENNENNDNDDNNENNGSYKDKIIVDTDTDEQIVEKPINDDNNNNENGDQAEDQTEVTSEGYANDADDEFVIDASNMIDKDDLDKIIEQILVKSECNLENELANAPQGSALVFVVMAEAIGQFDNGFVWTLLFFLMLFTLGLDSQFGTLEGIMSSLADLKPTSSSSIDPADRLKMTAIVCGSSFVISVLLFSHGAGSYMYEIFDQFGASFSLIVIALFELIAISYIYGLRRFCDDCELMTGSRPPFLIILSWRYISPIVLLVVVFATAQEFNKSIYYDAWNKHLGSVESKEWPGWCIVFGAFLVIACGIWIPAVAVFRILKINLVPEDKNHHANSNQWFPIEDLREYHNLPDEGHQVTKWERILFGFDPNEEFY